MPDGSNWDTAPTSRHQISRPDPPATATRREQDIPRAEAPARKDKQRISHAEAARARRQRVWAVRYPEEWDEWLRVQPLEKFAVDFGANGPFDFDTFLLEVGRRPSANHFIARVDETKPFMPGNMVWVARVPTPAPSPYLNVKQAAAFLGVAVQTIYNNRRHIPALPGFRRLMFDPKVLEKLLTSPRFMSKRLAGQRRSPRSTQHRAK